MFVISMVGKKTNFEGYQPTFRNMLTSFRSPPDTSETTKANNTGNSSLATSQQGQHYKGAQPSQPLSQPQILNTIPQFVIEN
jgi:hypothetical protein